jgi:hypothetical protein
MISRETIDQLTHVGVALVVVWFSSVIAWNWLAGAYLGAALGCVREYTQMESDLDMTLGTNRIRDIAYWAVGGALGGLTT